MDSLCTTVGDVVPDRTTLIVFLATHRDGLPRTPTVGNTLFGHIATQRSASPHSRLTRAMLAMAVACDAWFSDTEMEALQLWLNGDDSDGSVYEEAEAPFSDAE